MAINFTAVPGNLTCLLSGIKVCCPDWEKRGTTLCYPCSRGYTSETNGPCLPCIDDMYGEKCRFQCRCTIYEVCHHVYGCISEPTARQAFSQKPEVTSYGNGNELFSTSSSHCEKLRSFDPISVSMVFNVLLTVIIVLSCLVLVVHRCLVSRKKKKTLTGERPANRELIQQENNGESQYDLIDEQNMVELNLPIEQRGDHFDVIVNSTSFNGTRNQHNNDPEELVDHDIHTDRSGYLIPKGKRKNQLQRPAAFRTDDIGYLLPRSTHVLCENCKSQNLAQ